MYIQRKFHLCEVVDYADYVDYAMTTRALMANFEGRVVNTQFSYFLVEYLHSLTLQEGSAWQRS